jgi:hypothetical protein
MNRLSARLGQSGSYAHHPHLSLVDVAGLHRPTVRVGTSQPGHTVTAVVLHEEVSTFEELEAASK